MKILLLSPVCPNQSSSGSIMLYDLCSLVKKDQLYCFVARDPLLKKVVFNKTASIENLLITKRPIESPYHFPRWFFDKPLSHFIEKLKNIYIHYLLVPKMIRYGARYQIDCVWVILQGKTMILSALKVAQHLRVPLITQIWDDPEWILSSTGIGQYEKKHLMKTFHSTIRHSIICSTASWTMAYDFKRKYKVTTTAFLGSLDKTIAKRPAKKIHRKNELKIGFAGQMYAYDEFNSFLNALSMQNWQINTRQVKIYLLVSKIDAEKIPQDAKSHIHNLGYQSQQKTIDILSGMDILYCPYWLDKEHEKIARTSFPSKLTTYLAAGRPVFFHGPRYSTPAQFIIKNQCGILCSSLNTKTITKAMQSIIDPFNYHKITRSGSKAFNKYLTHQKLKKELDIFLNIARKVTNR